MLVLVVTGCDGDMTTSGEQAGQAVPVQREFKGQQGPFVDRGFFVIQRPEAWEALWGEVRPPAAIDFGQNSVLVALMGRQRTAGHEITITDVRQVGTQIEMMVTEQRPAADAVTAQVLTYPYHMVVVPKQTLPVFVTIAGVKRPPIVVQDEFLSQQCKGCEPQTIVLRDGDAWKALWTSTGRAGDAPYINFSRFMVVGIMLGTKPTSGYGIKIVSVVPANDHVVVHYRTQAPAKGAAVVNTPTSPYAIAILPLNREAIVFRNVADH
jgi:hypothetical protein